ncbi:MAG: nucleotidyltransferase family protein [Burkholderiales bacterium]
MEAIVLAGGLGTRLRQVVPDLPKPMAPVAGRPFLEILLTALAARGVDRVVLSVGHRAEAITGHFGTRWGGLEIEAAVEDTPLGTGGALRFALDRCRRDPVLVLNGDTFLDLDLEALARRWDTEGRPLIVARAVPDTARFGRLEAVDGQLAGFSEKGTAGPGLINAGTYLVPRDLLDAFPAGRPFSLETDYLVPRAVARGFGVFVSDGLFIDIGVPDDYARAQTLLAPFASKA